MASLKKLEFPSGTDVTEPSDLSVTNSANHLETYASDAAFVSANGTAVAGDFYLNTSAENPRVYVSGAWKDVGSGGAGGRNYLSSEFEGTRAVGTVTNGLTATGNRSANQDTWGADNTAKLTIANNTSSPLRQTGDFKITHVTTGTAFIESRMFNLDTADLNKAISISFDLTGNTTADDFDVVVMRYNSSGTYQETISVAGTASSGSPASAQLPTGTTKFTGFFISSNTQADYYSVRFRRLSAVATTSVQFDSFFAGPQTVITGQKIATSQVRADTGDAGTSHGSTATKIRRFTNATTVGSAITAVTGASSATTGSTFTINEAGIYSIHYSDRNSAGSFSIGISLNSANLTTNIFSLSAAERLTYVEGNTSHLVASATVRLAAGDVIRAHTNGSPNSTSSEVQFIITQTESLAPNTVLAERAVEEYASNSGTWDANDTTSFAYGIGGSAIGGSLTGTRTKRVKFTTPILASSNLEVQFSTDRITWLKTPCILNSNFVIPFLTTATQGAGHLINQQSSTEVNINFYQYQYMQAGGGDLTNWTSGYWRIKKTDGGASVGFPIAPANITLINSSDNYSGNTKLGLKVYAHGTTYNGGNAPTVTLTGGGGSLTAVDLANFIPYQMDDGTWRCKFNIAARFSATTRTSLVLNVAGLTSFSTGSLGQAITAYAMTASYTLYNSRAVTNSGDLNITHSSVSTDEYLLSGDIKLASKPTWAY